MVSQDITKETNQKVVIICLTVACVFVLLRTAARWFKIRQVPLSPEDAFIYVALASFAIMCAIYLAIIPTLYNVELIEAGEMLPYASLMADIAAMLKEFFAVQLFFWFTLWAVKWSLLFMFQRLTTGLLTYTRIWWGVMVFTILSFFGCVVSHFMSCSSMHAWFSPEGLCNKPQDAVAKAASLWYSLAVDLLTDLMIMAIPVQILYNLRISTAQKFSVGLVFTVGIITMIFAIVRVVSLDSSTRNGQVSTSWLILWAAIEGAVAIIVGSLPAFAVFIRGRVEASRAPYYGNSGDVSNKSKHNSHIQSSRRKSRARVESVMLDDVEAEAVPRISSDEGSKKSLVDGAIVVSQRWSQKWHSGTKSDLERERERKLGLNG